MKIKIKRLIPVLTVLILTVICFRQFFFHGMIPMPASFQMAWYEPWKSSMSSSGVPSIPHKAVGDDVFRQIYPFRDLAASLVKTYQLPLWNPYGGAGQPLLATLHTGIANPFSLLQLSDNTTGWAWFVMLQLPLLFLSTYWYMRTLTVGKIGAMFAAITVIFSGVAIARYMYGDYLYALAALPLLLGLLERGRTNRRYLFFVPFITAFLLVSVQPQISGYVLGTAVLYAFLLLRPLMGSFVGFVLLGIGLSLLQLLPTIELYMRANVTASSSEFIFQKFLMPVQHLITVILPNFFGNIGTYNFWGKTDYVETAASVGLVPIAAACIGVLLTKKPSPLTGVTRFFAVAWLIGVVATLDFFGTRLLYGLPLPILSTSIPTRLYLLTTFFIAVLGGIGFERAIRRKETKSVLTAGVYAALFGVALTALGITVVLSKYGILVCPSHIPNCVSVAVRNSLFELGIYGFVGILFLILATIRLPMMKNILSGSILLVITFSGLYNAAKFLPMSPREYVGASHPLIERLRSIAPSRVAGLESGVLATDLSTQYRYFDTNYYDPLYIKRYGELVSYVNTGNREKGITRSDVMIVSDASVSADLAFRRDRFWDMTGTALLATKKTEISTFLGIPVWEDETWRIYSRPTALPRAYLVSTLAVETHPEKTLSRMFAPDTDLTKTAFVDGSILLVPDPKKPQGGTVTIARYDAQRITLAVEAAQDSFLVLSDTYYPGWKADIDGNEVPVYRTNYTFRGILVPEGAHTVRFYYDPLSWRIGLLGTLVSLIVWLLFFVRKSSK